MFRLASARRNTGQQRLPRPAAAVGGLSQVHGVDQDVPVDFGTPVADAMMIMARSLADTAASIGRFEPLSIEIMRTYGPAFMDAHEKMNAALRGIMEAIPEALRLGEIKRRR